MKQIKYKTIILEVKTMKEVFSKFVRVDENRQVGVVETPQWIALEGTTYFPDTNETLTHRLSFSVQAGVELAQILQEWVNHKEDSIDG